MNLAAVLISALSVITTIIGLIITANANKKNLQIEIEKQEKSMQAEMKLQEERIHSEIDKMKTNIYLDEMRRLPLEIFDYYDRTIGAKKKLDNSEDEAHLKLGDSIESKIFAYGSDKSIKIFSAIRELNYKYKTTCESGDMTDEELEYNQNEYNRLFILLMSQVKYDLTGIKNNPEYWYKMRITNYSENKDGIAGSNNAIVRKLELDDFLLIK